MPDIQGAFKLCAALIHGWTEQASVDAGDRLDGLIGAERDPTDEECEAIRVRPGDC